MLYELVLAVSEVMYKPVYKYYGRKLNYKNNFQKIPTDL